MQLDRKAKNSKIYPFNEETAFSVAKGGLPRHGFSVSWPAALNHCLCGLFSLIFLMLENNCKCKYIHITHIFQL